MSEIEKQFVPFSIASKLKEIGFDEMCLGIFYKEEFKLADFISQPYVKNSEVSDKIITAPLWQQVTDWFIINHNLVGYIKPIPSGYRVEVHQPSDIEEEWEQWGRMPFDLYQEAKVELIEKIFEIIESKNNG